MSALEVATVTVGWLVLTFSGAIHTASTGLLNDTGQLRCDDGSTVLAPCTDANAGDGSTGWRVPAHRELPSIVNNGLSVAFATRFFPDAPRMVLPGVLNGVWMWAGMALLGLVLHRRVAVEEGLA